jgi:FKBP-type peptidyl-prolyl cis-trans isomerase
VPFDVVIGVGQVIKGWDVGIPGMRVGEKRRLVIPSDLGYGTKGFPPAIPANSNLNFEVEVLEAK